MTHALRPLAVVAGLLSILGWTVPYTVAPAAFARAALVPPSHGAFLPWVGVLLGVLGAVLLVRGLMGRAGVVLAAVSSTIMLVVGVIHIHQIVLHAAPTIWSWVDTAWPLAIGVLLKLAIRKQKADAQ